MDYLNSKMNHLMDRLAELTVYLDNRVECFGVIHIEEVHAAVFDVQA